MCSYRSQKGYGTEKGSSARQEHEIASSTVAGLCDWKTVRSVRRSAPKLKGERTPSASALSKRRSRGETVALRLYSIPGGTPSRIPWEATVQFPRRPLVADGHARAASVSAERR